MNQIELNGYLLQGDIPEIADSLEISIQDDGIPCLSYYSFDNFEPTIICLPPGNWVKECFASEIEGGVYNGFIETEFGGDIEKFHSLLRKEGMTATNTLILKKD